MGNTGSHLPDRCQSINSLQLLKVQLFQLNFGSIQAINHGVEAHDQTADLVSAAVLEADAQITVLNLRHCVNNPVKRFFYGLQKNERDGECQKDGNCNG